MVIIKLKIRIMSGLMHQGDFSKLAGVSLVELLKPLHNESLSFEYKNHFKTIEDFVKRLRQLEIIYAQVYDQILSMEKKMIESKNNISVK
jgi:hypothetical protein